VVEEEDVVLEPVLPVDAVSRLFSLGQSDSSSLKKEEEDGAPGEDFLSKESRSNFVMSGMGLPGVALVLR
jgi:hypothetical protein